MMIGRDDSAEPPFSPDGRTRDFRGGLDQAQLADTTPRVAAEVIMHRHRGTDRGVNVVSQHEYENARWPDVPRMNTFETLPNYSRSHVDRYGLFKAAELAPSSNHDGTVHADELAGFLEAEFGASIDAREAARIVTPSATW